MQREPALRLQRVLLHLLLRAKQLPYLPRDLRSPLLPDHQQVLSLLLNLKTLNFRPLQIRKTALHKVIPPEGVRRALLHLKATCPALANLVKVYLLPLALVLQPVHLRHSRHNKLRDGSRV